MTDLPRRRIGRDGPTTGILALGSWHTYDRMHFPDAVRLLRRAIDAGITLFDVGVYGTPERPPVFTDVLFSAMVRAAGLRRDDYLFSAKLWLEEYPAESLRAQLENALFRAGVEHADLVVLGEIRHAVDLRAIVSELAELRAAGLIRHWGVNNWSATTIREVHGHAAATGLPGPALAQLVHNVARRSVVDGAPFAKVFDELGVSLESSDVFEGGRLLGKGRAPLPDSIDPVLRRIVDSADDIRKAADSIGATPAQLCLAFTLTHPANTTTLFGATSVEQLDQNLAAVGLLDRVGADDLRTLVAPFWADRDLTDPEGP
ncbi:aldo/keto reductase [Kutzneria sp. CA-103260]|uniref:aldo/keto reductase n=1 Tax=Kutzneria sp. CA-103260 TaxID=2802641 RepID=UPI001BAC2A68|nr:aldo/keto reductase [Kutzneria sp. CA-103260]QUQ65622.1 aldo/keto reductase [Kutzneria sp. CA-103260]